MTPVELKHSALNNGRPPAGLGEVAQALWYFKPGD